MFDKSSVTQGIAVPFFGLERGQTDTMVQLKDLGFMSFYEGQGVDPNVAKVKDGAGANEVCQILGDGE